MKTRKRFLSLCLCLSLLLGLMPAASLTVSAEEETGTEQVAPVIANQYGDFMVAVTSGSAEVSSTGAYLILAYGGTYEISMADGVETTSMYIFVDGASDSNTTITLNGVSISSSASALQLVVQSNSSGSDQTISLQLLGTNSLVSSEGAGIEKNVRYYNGEPDHGTGTLRISGTGSLTATGGGKFCRNRQQPWI